MARFYGVKGCKRPIFRHTRLGILGSGAWKRFSSRSAISRPNSWWIPIASSKFPAVCPWSAASWCGWTRPVMWKRSWWRAYPACDGEEKVAAPPGQVDNCIMGEVWQGYWLIKLHKIHKFTLRVWGIKQTMFNLRGLWVARFCPEFTFGWPCLVRAV